MTKPDRLSLISELIERYPIMTQEELQLRLQKHGCHVTQATVSRDMKELRLSKTVGADGVYCYGLPKESPEGLVPKFKMIFRESVVSIARSGNIVIIKCLAGMGNAACEALDAMQFPGILGTIAGDNTIFAVVEEPEDGQVLIAKLNQALEV